MSCMECRIKQLKIKQLEKSIERLETQLLVLGRQATLSKNAVEAYREAFDKSMLSTTDMEIMQ